METGNTGNTSPKVKLFREKSLEAIESPESLNDYLRVTSPGVWLILAAVITLLVGGLLWSILGRIETTAELAVSSQGGKAVCYVPYEKLEDVLQQGSVTLDGQSYTLAPGDEASMTIISEETSPFVRLMGNLQMGDVVVEVPLNAELNDGAYKATAVTESLRPLSLLFE